MAVKKKALTPRGSDGVLPSQLEVSAVKNKRRRAGIEFTESPQLLDVEKLNDDQIDAIKSDNMLRVREVYPAPADATKS